MKNITIKKNIELIKLATMLGRSPDLLIKQILEIAYNYQYIADDTCESGNLLIDNIVDEIGDLYTKEGSCLLHTGSHDKKAVDLFCQLRLFGTGDCPECGGETEDISKWKSFDRDLPMEIDGIEKRRCINCKHEII